MAADGIFINRIDRATALISYSYIYSGGFQLVYLIQRGKPAIDFIGSAPDGGVEFGRLVGLLFFNTLRRSE